MALEGQALQDFINGFENGDYVEYGNGCKVSIEKHPNFHGNEWYVKISGANEKNYHTMSGYNATELHTALGALLKEAKDLNTARPETGKVQKAKPKK